MKNKNFTFKKADISEIYDIHKILNKSFEPYKKFYPDQAFAATVISPLKVRDRIVNKDYEVFVTVFDKQIVGTVSLCMKNEELYICSMAVLPDFQRIGIGRFMLDNICHLAEKKGVKKIVLESSKPLKKALNFYEKIGFKKSGITRDYYGIEVFEMIKSI